MSRCSDREIPNFNYDSNANYFFDYSFKRKILTLYQNEKTIEIPIRLDLKRTLSLAVREIFQKDLEKKLKEDLE